MTRRPAERPRGQRCDWCRRRLIDVADRPYFRCALCPDCHRQAWRDCKGSPFRPGDVLRLRDLPDAPLAAGEGDLRYVVLEIHGERLLLEMYDGRDWFIRPTTYMHARFLELATC